MDFIDSYNEKVKNAGEEDKEINYTDTTGILMNSVKTIVNAVTYVLIAFVSISLIVSSIMIGIITYISVYERTKEIGILRAIGASKKDVSRVFKSETFIEEALIEFLKKNNVASDIVKTKEYVDFDALESAIYHERISPELVKEMASCKETKTTTVLRIKQKKGV
jgi:hypothetical protein